MDAFTIEAFALLGIGLAVIGLRTYWRLSTVGIRNLKADDYLMLLAAIWGSRLSPILRFMLTISISGPETYLAYSVGKLWHGLANNGMTDDERRLLNPSSEEYRLRVGGSKTQIAGWSTYTFLLWVLKAAMCTFYIRLTSFSPFFLVASLWRRIGRFILTQAACAPTGSYFMDITTNQDADFCQPAISKVDIFVTVVLNVVTDLYLLTIPIPMLWQSSIKPVKKAALIVMFSGGVFVTAAGVLRCVLIITNPVTGAQQAGSWAVRETFVAVITTNLPMVFPMFRIWLYLSQARYASTHRVLSRIFRRTPAVELPVVVLSLSNLVALLASMIGTRGAVKGLEAWIISQV
ncbi:hypothetical protein PG987_009956 [Apiospora arundinis]